MTSHTTKPNPLLMVYKELTGADLLKLQAISNISTTGGGARDLRLPAAAFRTVMHRIFDQEQTKADGSALLGQSGDPVRVARVTYKDEHGQIRATELEYWPPTNSRPREDRVAKVHASPAIGGRLPRDDRGRVFVLFIRWSNGDVGCYYAYEADLRRKGAWGAEVRSAILSCIADTDQKNATRVSNKVPVQGYYDFTDGTAYCHAS